MSDAHPSTLRVEIDRQALKNYLRLRWFITWALSLFFLGALVGFGTIPKALDEREVKRKDIPVLCAIAVVGGAGIGLGLAVLLYLCFSHRFASRFANSLDVSVEGAFLCLRYQFYAQCDRKLHFRSIVDYTTTQDFLMRRFQISALQMTTTAGGPTSTITVLGIKDCLKIRDILSEIDAQREHS